VVVVVVVARQAAMGCFPCFGPAREEELEYYGAKGGGNGSAAGWAAASSSAAAAAAAGGGGAEAAALCAERIPAGACAASTRPLLPLPDRSLGLLVGSESDPCCGALVLGPSLLVSWWLPGWVGRSVWYERAGTLAGGRGRDRGK